ncbi:Gfo/Idh/MocA family protein [Paenibacillus sp. J2TS4]|uniref:Gfo/Idh/MocA family protein n=1 Tax=Paenibacillus sp. J2TS4 TaxID=2807194 RepID=UPI001B15FE4A|nr:Gfo/Idh/MocA family oxidoreductase [Paenibacillus sp. J2TS4]GIP33720.1 oxidoreductase [Paenibacillus sp. J2TS4]
MRKLRWGVLGTGRIISKAGLAIHRAENSEWIGIAGRSADTGREAAETYGLERRYDHYQELVDDPDIDAVYISLLNHLHKEWAIKALNAGKHVLLEKPFTLNRQEAIEVAEAAKANGVQVMEAHSWRYQEGYHRIKAIIDEGAIGDLAIMCSHFSFMASADSTRWVQKWGGGALYDIGCYPVAWSRFLMGSEPEAVECRMTMSSTGVDARFIGTLYYSDGRVAHCSAAFDMANGSGFELYGTRGRLSLTTDTKPESVTLSAAYNGQTQQWVNDRVQPYVSQVEGFADAILQGRPAPFSVEDAIQQMAIIDALFRADRERTRIYL